MIHHNIDRTPPEMKKSVVLKVPFCIERDSINIVRKSCDEDLISCTLKALNDSAFLEFRVTSKIPARLSIHLSS
jgi:hypothetical protein